MTTQLLPLTAQDFRGYGYTQEDIRLVLKHAQAMIEEAREIAQRLNLIIYCKNDVFSVVVLDEADHEITELGETGLSDYRLAVGALNRIRERLNSNDPDLLTLLLTHIETQYPAEHITA